MIQKFDYIEDLRILILNSFNSLMLDSQIAKTEFI